MSICVSLSSRSHRIVPRGCRRRRLCRKQAHFGKHHDYSLAYGNRESLEYFEAVRERKRGMKRLRHLAVYAVVRRMNLLVIVGHVNLPPSAFEQWEKIRLDSTKFDDWPEGPPMFTGKSPRTHATVRDVLNATTALSGVPDFFEFDGEMIRGLLTPESTNALHQDLATALRLLGNFDATGQVYFFIPEEGVTFLVNIGDPHAACGHDHDDDHEHPAVDWADAEQVLHHDESTSLGFVRITEFLRTWAEDKSLTRKAFLLERAQLGLRPIAEQPHHQKLLALVSSLNIENLHAKMVSEVLTDGDQVQLAKYFPTAEALRAGLSEAQPHARAAAGELLSLLEPTLVEEWVGPLLGDPSRDVRRHGLFALGRAGSDSALARLLELSFDDDEDTEMVEARLHAVALSQAPNAATITAGQLDSPSVSRAAWQEVERATPEREALASKANRALELAAAHASDETTNRLCELFERHDAEEVRIAAARALAQIGGPKLEAHAMALNCTLLGMGRGLNNDDTRRKAILGVSKEDYASGLLRVSNIDHSTLTTLLRENFANPESMQNDSPSIGMFAEILEEYPELRVGGYLIAPNRDDYRLSLDSITCPSVKDVPKVKQEAVKELFESLSESATNTDAEPGSLHCWWT